MPANFIQTLFSIFLAGVCFLALGEFLYLDLTGLGKKKAIREFTPMAQSLGFKVKEKSASQDFGTFRGRYEGYHFIIDPDHGAKITLEMRVIKGLKAISTVKGETTFSTTNSKFDATFQTRQVSTRLIPRMQQATNFHQNALQFSQQWHRKYSALSIDDDDIVCVLRYGSSSYIPASVLKEIIPDMVKLANAIQQDLNNSK